MKSCVINRSLQDSHPNQQCRDKPQSDAETRNCKTSASPAASTTCFRAHYVASRKIYDLYFMGLNATILTVLFMNRLLQQSCITGQRTNSTSSCCTSLTAAFPCHSKPATQFVWTCFNYSKLIIRFPLSCDFFCLSTSAAVSVVHCTCIKYAWRWYQNTGRDWLIAARRIITATSIILQIWAHPDDWMTRSLVADLLQGPQGVLMLVMMSVLMPTTSGLQLLFASLQALLQIITIAIFLSPAATPIRLLLLTLQYALLGVLLPTALLHLHERTLRARFLLQQQATNKPTPTSTTNPSTTPTSTTNPSTSDELAPMDAPTLQCQLSTSCQVPPTKTTNPLQISTGDELPPIHAPNSRQLSTSCKAPLTINATPPHTRHASTATSDSSSSSSSTTQDTSSNTTATQDTSSSSSTNTQDMSSSTSPIPLSQSMATASTQSTSSPPSSVTDIPCWQATIAAPASSTSPPPTVTTNLPSEQATPSTSPSCSPLPPAVTAASPLQQATTAAPPTSHPPPTFTASPSRQATAATTPCNNCSPSASSAAWPTLAAMHPTDNQASTGPTPTSPGILHAPMTAAHPTSNHTSNHTDTAFPGICRTLTAAVAPTAAQHAAGGVTAFPDTSNVLGSSTSAVPTARGRPLFTYRSRYVMEVVSIKVFDHLAFDYAGVLAAAAEACLTSNEPAGGRTILSTTAAPGCLQLLVSIHRLGPLESLVDGRGEAA